MIDIDTSTTLVTAAVLAWFANWCLTAYYHRMCAHRSIVIKEPLLTVVRVTTWMTQFGITAPSWVGMHVMHHRHEDTEHDPHSPKFKNFWKLFLIRSWGREFNQSNRKVYIDGIRKCNWDRMERFFAKNSDRGFLLFAFICFLLFGTSGLIIWGVVLGVTAFSNAYIVTFAHTVGYRNAKNTLATNNPLFCFILAGEEWHNNHHARPNTANFGGTRWWEIDTGYCLIWLFSKINAIEIK